MIQHSLIALVALTVLVHRTISIPTWPSSIDELEDIMLLNQGYRARGFADPVTPCSKGAAPGRNAAAERIRTAFHDMAPGNAIARTGGLDASIMFEFGGDNPGPGFPTTLTSNVPFFSSRSSMADLIAFGVYTAVRACGGPIVSMKGGRVDATERGNSGVPQPQNSLFTFQNQFQRMGFNPAEMIALVACGHSLGAVHTANFPLLVPAGSTPGGYQEFDTTAVDAPAFDSKIASEYVAGTTKDALVVGPSVARRQNSDGVVFGSDGNVTIRAMADPATFKSRCSTLLQRMVELVPSATTLTDVIVPYDVKPAALQLDLIQGGDTISFSGEIRVRTTTRAASQIGSVRLAYKDRSGGAGGTITTAVKGAASGFDDTFTFYGFSSSISSTSSISSFTVAITLTSGATETYDNNGAGFPVDDTIFFLKPQSCLNGGELTVAAAVRNTAAASSAGLDLTLKVPRTDGIVVPQLLKTSVTMAQKATAGPYKLFSASYTGDVDQLKTAKFDVTAGTAKDSFKNAGDLSNTCAAFPSGSASTTSSSTTSSATSSTSVTTASPTSSSTSVTSSASSSSSSSSSSSTSTTPTSSGPAQPTFSGYAYEGCYTDSTSARVFTGRNTASNGMTYSSCASFCSSYNYFAVEYASECFCGNSFANPTKAVPDGECNMPCAGDSKIVCGAGNRLTVFKDLTPPAPAPSASIIPGYVYRGCFTDNTGGRVLNTGPALFSNSMTLEKCAMYCKDHDYFGTEYAEECWCGDRFANPTASAPESECNYPCAGNSRQLCGAGNRLSIYEKSATPA